jgi:outer membrane autotransporter protein
MPANFVVAEGWTLSPKLDLGLQHGFDRFQPGQLEGFAGVAGTSFTVLGDRLDRDALVSGLGVDLNFGGASLSLSYDGLLSSREQSNSFKAQLNLPL